MPPLLSRLGLTLPTVTVDSVTRTPDGGDVCKVEYRFEMFVHGPSSRRGVLGFQTVNRPVVLGPWILFITLPN